MKLINKNTAEIIRKQFSQIGSYIRFCTEYFHDSKNTLMGIAPDVINELDILAAELPEERQEIIAEMTKWLGEDPPKIITIDAVIDYSYNIFCKLRRFAEGMAAFQRFITDKLFIRSALFMRSTTYNIETQKKIVTALNVYNEYIAQKVNIDARLCADFWAAIDSYDPTHEKIVDWLCEMPKNELINSSDDLIDIHSISEDITDFTGKLDCIPREINFFTVRICAYIIQSYLNHSKISSQNNSRLKLIRHLIEAKKDLCLDEAYQRILAVNRRPFVPVPHRLKAEDSPYMGCQQLIYRSNLTPATDFIEPKELMTFFNNEYIDSVTADTMVGKNNTRNKKNIDMRDYTALFPCDHNIVIINNSNTSAIEFGLRGILDNEYLARKDLVVPIESGLNKKIFSRFNNLRILETSKNCVAGPIVFKRAKVYSPYWYVVETNDGGINWRLLGLQTNYENNFKYQIRLAENNIYSILEGVATRPIRYNCAMSEKIFTSCFDPRADEYIRAYINTETSLPNPEAIKDEISREMKQWVEQNIQSITDVKKIYSVFISHEHINEIIVRILFSSISDRKMLDNMETVMSCLSRFHLIAEGFYHEVERQWFAHIIPSNIFENYSANEARQIIKKSILDIYQRAIAALDNLHEWISYNISLKEFVMAKKNISL